MTISQEFKEALIINKAEADSFKPLLDKFEELKEILQSNFKITTKEGPWCWFKKYVTKPVIYMNIEDKITHRSGKYLFIKIGGTGCVMGLGEVGELKDRLYFIEGRYTSKSRDKQIVYVTNHMFGTLDYCLEDKITNVQLFSDLIKRYNDYLIPQ